MSVATFAVSALLAAGLAPVSTAPLVETTQYPAGADYRASCARSTGTPGQITLATTTGVRFLDATRTGYRPVGDVDLGDDPICPLARVRPNGAGVLAGAVNVYGNGALVVAVRDPGGDWSAPASIAVEDTRYIDDVTASVADSGDAVVAWIERDVETGKRRLRVTRRAPGATFGRIEEIGTPAVEAAIWAEVAATGETFLMTTSVESERIPIRMPLRIAVAARGEAFPSLTPIATIPWRSSPAVAVAPDGHALVAFPDGASVLVSERVPAGTFGTPLRVAGATDATGNTLNAAVGGDGQAAVAWTGDEQGAVGMVTRATAGAFTEPVVVRPQARLAADPFYVSQTFALATRSFRSHAGDPYDSLALTGDGHAALTAMRDQDVHGVHRRVATLTTVPLGGTLAETRSFGGELGLGVVASPLPMADGTAALAWSERIDESGTMHLAVRDGIAPTVRPAPAVHVGAPASPVLGGGSQLVLPVRCGGPCDVRAQALGSSRANGRLRLARGGSGKIKLDQGAIPIAPARLGPVRIRLTYGTIASQRPDSRVITVRLVRPPDPPLSRVDGLRAARRGDTIRVTWRVTHPSSVALYLVSGAATRGWSGEPLAFANKLDLDGRRRFAVTLRGTKGVQWVTLRSSSSDDRVVVPVASAVTGSPRRSARAPVTSGRP